MLPRISQWGELLAGKATNDYKCYPDVAVPPNSTARMT